MARFEDARRVLSGILMVASKALEESQLLRTVLRTGAPLAGQRQGPFPSSLDQAVPPPTQPWQPERRSVPPVTPVEEQVNAAALQQPAPESAAAAAVQQPAPAADVAAAAAAAVDHTLPPAAALAAAPSSLQQGAGTAADAEQRHAVLEPEVHGMQGVTILQGEDAQPQPEASTSAAAAPASPARIFKPRERAVPSTSLGRAVGFAGLGASLLWGTVQESVSRTFRGAGGTGQGGSGAPHPSSAWISEQNAERLANALCRMRGAALKIGQMLSIQDENVLPPQFAAALERVRAGADIMPRRQLEKVLVGELGPHWQSKVAHFDFSPMAAASIGQVHSATLHDGREVCMKIQYPGVKDSIGSDVNNLMRLISVANVLPKGLYVENAVTVAKRELALECDYRYEAAAQSRFKTLIEGDPRTAAHFSVPAVVPELSAERVLASERAAGVHIDRVARMPQAVRDAVGARLLALTLQELFEWRFMQTDPNWGNFLYDAEADRINLIDFGAARDYPLGFVADYLQMVRACAERDRAEVVARSRALGFLTGDESRVMLDAHVEAGVMVGVPFSTPGLYDFGFHGSITRRVTELGSVMLRHRLTPPPDESYSLHRKLSGAFLACIKLKARVPCHELFYHTVDNFQAQQRERQEWEQLDQLAEQQAAAA